MCSTCVLCTLHGKPNGTIRRGSTYIVVECENEAKNNYQCLFQFRVCKHADVDLELILGFNSILIVFHSTKKWVILCGTVENGTN